MTYMHSKVTTLNQNCSGKEKWVTVKHTEMYLRPRNGTKYSASEKKNTDNFTVKIL
jgi:hypothetical protein